ncbi:hypothetical protein [Paraburkholderia sp.]|uniref:hypothetical protein n=1 Tax=Paraburkholderia sp. TaxID=1926495 RepID=UPI0025D3C8A4|nr:hypothetical protein [Paraburkholderia sp.]
MENVEQIEIRDTENGAVGHRQREWLRQRQCASMHPVNQDKIARARLRNAPCKRHDVVAESKCVTASLDARRTGVRACRFLIRLHEGMPPSHTGLRAVQAGYQVRSGRQHANARMFNTLAQSARAQLQRIITPSIHVKNTAIRTRRDLDIPARAMSPHLRTLPWRFGCRLPAAGAVPFFVARCFIRPAFDIAKRMGAVVSTMTGLLPYPPLFGIHGNSFQARRSEKSNRFNRRFIAARSTKTPRYSAIPPGVSTDSHAAAIQATLTQPPRHTVPIAVRRVRLVRVIFLLTESNA